MPSLSQFQDVVFRRSDGATSFVLRTTAVAWAVCGAVLLSIDILHPLPEPHEPLRSLAYELFIAWIGGVFIENIAMVGLIEMIDPSGNRWRSTIVVVAILSGALHSVVASWRGIAGAILFATMAYSYQLWRDASFNRRYLITVLQHLLFNLPATIMRLVEG